MSLLAEYNLPFAISFGLMVLALVLQVIGLGDFDFGGDVELDIDLDGDIDADAIEVPEAGLGGALLTLLGMCCMERAAVLATTSLFRPRIARDAVHI